MASTIHSIALVWACLSCVGVGDRVQTATKDAQRRLVDEGRGRSHPSNALARLLLASDPTAALQLWRPGAADEHVVSGHTVRKSGIIMPNAHAGKSRILMPNGRAQSPLMMPRSTPYVPYKYPGYERTQWISVYDRMIRDRILFLNGYIEDQLSNQMIAVLLYLQNEDATKPVSMYCNIGGGLTKSGLAIYDAMSTMPFDIQTVNMGMCSDIGAFLVASGTPGKRVALPNSMFSLTSPRMDPPTDNEGRPQQMPMQATEMKVEVEEVLRDKQRILDGYASFTGQSVDKLKKDFMRDFYLTAEQAAEYGLIDKILEAKPKP